jgi:hypothetical protein
MRHFLLFACSIAALAACVDGTTPNCSDAATQCGPDLDATIEEASVDATLDGSNADSKADAPADVAPEATADTGSDAGVDAGD